MKIFIEPKFTKYYSKYPLVLADVGASGGLEDNWKPARKYLQIIGFEPDTREFNNLIKRENAGTKYLNIGLYNQKISLKYNLMKKQQVSSMFIPNMKFLDQFPESDRFEIVEEVEIPVDTLDSQLKVNGIGELDFIKIDTQGSELFILEGAEKTLQKNVFGIEVEVEFIDIYEGQPLFGDVDNFLRKRGFELFDIQGSYWKREVGKKYHKKRGQLIFGNALYLRNVGAFKKIIDQLSEIEEKKAKILKAISICFLYGYFDYAETLLDGFAGIFEDVEQKEIINTFKASQKFFDFGFELKGRGRLAALIYSLWERVRPTHGGWAVTDRKLGNL